MQTSARGLVVGVALVALGCRTEAADQPGSAPPFAASETVDDVPASADSNPSDAPDPDPESAANAGPVTPYTPASTLGPAIEIRKATLSRAVYFEAETGSPLRGRINHGDNFRVYAHVEGPDCKQPWGQVADGGWICLERTELDHGEPQGLPVLASGQRLPFIYARHKRHNDASTPALPVYASVAAFNRGDEPIDTLPAYGSYAFTRSIANHGARVFMTATRRVVAAAELRKFDPSDFGGEALDAERIPEGLTLAWAVRRETVIRETGEPEGAVVASVPFHAPMLVRGPGVRGSDGELWFEVPAHADNPGSGWISDDEIRRFLPVAPPAPILAGQITVDVDLDEQVLSVWREAAPVFATLISSGKPGDSTPVGLYRLETKWAYGKMANQQGTADDPYFVDAVPWAMYFDGRYALHAAYWHDMFGHRRSHGCVNLSPLDAKRVFDLVTPTLPAGWLLVHEHASDPGSVVRIRQAGKPITEHREQL